MDDFSDRLVDFRQTMSGSYSRGKLTGKTMVKEIAASLDRGIETVADIENFSQAVPKVVGVEFLSDNKSGTVTRFREKQIIRAG